MMIKVLVNPEPLRSYSVSVPELPGCYSEGETLSEALHNIQEAAQLWFEVASEIAQFS
jgi:antitoxin HicB